MSVVFEYKCKENHLVVGPQDDSSLSCPECGPETVVDGRWRLDPYIVYHSDLAFESGLFQHKEVSYIQQLLLTAVVTRRRISEEKRRQSDLLQQLWIADPKRHAAVSEALVQQREDGTRHSIPVVPSSRC